MKRILAAVMLGFGFSVPAAAQFEHCNVVRERVKAGIDVGIELEAVELYDATRRVPLWLRFLLVPTVFDRCVYNDVYVEIFHIAKDVQIRTSRASYTAAWNAEYPHVLVDNETKLNGGQLTAYHSVFAALMQELGFDSFESATGSAFPTLLDTVFVTIPHDRQWSGLLGVGRMNQRLYQIMVKRVAMAMP